MTEDHAIEQNENPHVVLHSPVFELLSSNISRWFLQYDRSKDLGKRQNIKLDYKNIVRYPDYILILLISYLYFYLLIIYMNV